MKMEYSLFRLLRDFFLFFYRKICDFLIILIQFLSIDREKCLQHWHLEF